MKKIKKLISLSLVTAIFAGCTPASYDDTHGRPMNVPAGENTKKGAIYGAIAGAILGGITSGHKNKEKHILQGAVIGAAVGGAFGYSLDRQAAKMAKALDTNVDNSPNAQANPNKNIIVSKRANYVLITFRDKMMFPTNSATPTPTAQEKISRVSAILREYPQTIVQVAGFTDNRGSYAYNLELSKKRARTVATTLKSSGIPNRVFAKGCSYNKAIVPNTTPANMALNRRVELYLYPNQSVVVDPCK